MHDSVNLACSVFGLTRFLNCLNPAAGTAVLVQRQDYMGRNIREGTYIPTCTKAAHSAAEMQHQRQSEKALLHYLRHKELVCL